MLLALASKDDHDFPPLDRLIQDRASWGGPDSQGDADFGERKTDQVRLRRSSEAG